MIKSFSLTKILSQKRLSQGIYYNNTFLQTMNSPQISKYDPTNHSLLKQIYMYPYAQKSVGKTKYK